MRKKKKGQHSKKKRSWEEGREEEPTKRHCTRAAGTKKGAKQR